MDETGDDDLLLVDLVYGKLQFQPTEMNKIV